MPLPNYYNTGTISIGTAATTVVGVGTFWTPFASQFCVLMVPGIGCVVVTAIPDDTHLTIPAWQGGALSNVAYQLLNLPLSSLQASNELRDILTGLRGQGFIFSVTGAAPDNSVGIDGQYALKTNTGNWQQWLKAAGVWVLQATPVGVTNRGAWSSATNYVVNDIVNDLGTVYLSNTSNLNHRPASNPTDWSVFGAKGDIGGTGDPGAQGNPGRNGDTGPSGNTILYGSGAPSNLLGKDGDSYRDMTGNMIYGPKTAGSWPAGTSLAGSQGSAGGQGQGIAPNATGTFAQRATYDGQPQGFVFLETDVSPALLWVKASNTTADWAGPTLIGSVVPVGSLGSIADSLATSSFSYGPIA